MGLNNKTLISGLVVTSSVLAFVVGNATNHRRATVDNNFCVLDTAIVTFMQKTMAGVTRADAAKDPKRWEIYRAQNTDFINTIANIAPCKIVVQIPPDPLT